MTHLEKLFYKILSSDAKLYFKNVESISNSLKELVKLKKMEMKIEQHKEEEELIIQKSNIDSEELDNLVDLNPKEVKNLLGV